MADFERHGRFRLPSIILEVDPPQHSRSRAVLNKALSPAVMRGLRRSLEAAATEPERRFNNTVRGLKRLPVRLATD